MMDRSMAPVPASMCISNKKNKKQREHQQQSSGCDMYTTRAMAMRKGPWTEEEDAQLVWFVRLFGERRWDFLAKVSGLRRTGKSCRLRWVNYLHPGLQRGRITADEERLILQLHAQWGSRWSRIARSLPGRTDNEIKNFWRTRTRKQKAQQENNHHRRKTAAASPTSSSSITTCCSVSPSSGSGGGAATSSSAVTESALRESTTGDDDAEAELDEAASTTSASQHHQHQQHKQECYDSMDQLWSEIAAAEAAASYLDNWGTGHGAAADQPPPSPVWEFCSDYSLWKIDDDEYYKN